MHKSNYKRVQNIFFSIITNFHLQQTDCTGETTTTTVKSTEVSRNNDTYEQGISQA